MPLKSSSDSSLNFDQVIQINQKRNHRTLLCMKKITTDNLNSLFDLSSIQFNQVLWVYSKKLSKFDSTNKLPFEKITFVTYEDKLFNKRILGHSFDLVVLQHFSSLTPNIMGQCIDTCRGRGVVIIETLVSLKKLDSLKMDRKATEQSLFNKRLSIILSQYNKQISGNYVASKEELSVAIDSEADKHGLLSHCIGFCQSSDQSNAMLSIVNELCSNRLHVQIMIKGGRGRGKTMLLALVISCLLLVEWKSDLSWCQEILLVSCSQSKLVFKLIDKICCQYLQVKKDKNQLQISTEDGRSTFIRTANISQALSSNTLIFVDEAASINNVSWLDRLIAKCSRLILTGTCTGYESSGGRSMAIKHQFNLNFQLDKPIRYNKNDPVEEMLSRIFCLSDPIEKASYPPLESTSLFLLNKQKLFDGSEQSELLLSSVIHTISEAHYRHSPNDIQMIADCERHHLAVLGKCPEEPCCVMHIAVEEGKNLVPSVLSDLYGHPVEFWAQSLRIIRIASKYKGLGYGSRALELLASQACVEMANQSLEDLYCKLNSTNFTDRPVFISVSFGLTTQLARFWHRNKFIPLYVRVGKCPQTGEHSCIMVKSIYEDQCKWIQPLYTQFSERFKYQLRWLSQLNVEVCQKILSFAFIQNENSKNFLNENQLERLHRADFVDYHLILDILCLIDFEYYGQMSSLQQSILIGLGLQGKHIQIVARELNLPVSQIRALLNRALRQILRQHNYEVEVVEKEDNEVIKRTVKDANLDDVLG